MLGPGAGEFAAGRNRGSRGVSSGGVRRAFRA